MNIPINIPAIPAAAHANGSDATVDGRFVVFDAIEKSSTYACELTESWLRPSGKTHHLRFEVMDNRQNTGVFEATFAY